MSDEATDCSSWRWWRWSKTEDEAGDGAGAPAAGSSLIELGEQAAFYFDSHYD